MAGEIEVRLRVEDAPLGGINAYFDWVERECIKAGVPFSDGEPENGVLFRRDDPEDFGCTIWVYVPNRRLTELYTMTQNKEHCHNNRSERVDDFSVQDGWRLSGERNLILIPDRMSKECGQIAGMEPPGCTGCKYLREPL